MVLVFGEHRLDIDRRELHRGAELVDLEPKAFDLLVFLVRNNDRVVSKNELLDAVWDGRIVSESALTTRINAVRRGLGDDGATQRLIRTFTRKGVRFVGEVTELPDRVGPPVGGTLGPASAITDKPSIAVLAFQNLSGDPEQEYFADGMVEEITTAIARCSWLFVIARNSSFRYKGKPIDASQTARELGVRYVLEGSVRKAGNRVRIAGHMIDSTTGAHIWVDRFDGTLDDIFELQDRVASGVVGAIEPRLRRAEAERAVRKPTASLDAYDLYWRAQAQAYKRTCESLAESIRLARLALDIDPAYGPAMSRIALSRGMQRQRNWIHPQARRSRKASRWPGRRSPPPGMTLGCWILPGWRWRSLPEIMTPRSARSAARSCSTPILPSPSAIAPSFCHISTGPTRLPARPIRRSG